MKRLQVMLKDETCARLTETLSKCNDGFNEGTVKTQNLVEWIIAHSIVDVHKIRQQCLSLKKILNNAPVETRVDLDELVRKIGLVKSLLKEKEGT